MSTWPLKSEQDRKDVIRAIGNRDLPCTVSIKKGLPRSTAQNRLNRLWMLEAESQGDHTAEEYRGLCKLHFAIPILIAEDDDFAEVYQRVIAPLPYEDKLACMMVPIDLPVTRRLSTKGEKAYLDRVYNHFVGKGFKMTDPETMGYGGEG